MAKSIFNLDTIRNAKQTYSTSPTATPMGRIAAPTKATPINQAAANLAKVATPTVSRTESTLNNIQNTVNQPFSYDPNSDPAYQSALKSAQQNLSINQKNTNAQLRATGQGKSSYSETVANQLANQSAADISNNILPQYMQQAYGRYQDNISNQSNLYGLQYQQDVTTPQNEATLTGNYLPPEAKIAIDNLLKIKTQAETKGITATERTGLSKEADVLRNQLKALGIDPSYYGADKTAAQASAANPALRTLQGQQVDQSAQAQSFNQTQMTQEFAYKKARDAISDKQWQQSFDQNASQFGMDFALKQLSQQDDQSYRQASLALSQDDNLRQWATLDYNQSQPDTTKYQGLTANQVLSNVKELYQEPVYTDSVDPLTKKVTKVDSGKTKLTTDSAKLTQMFETVVDAGLSETETKQILLSLGMTMKDIEKRAGAYSGN